MKPRRVIDRGATPNGEPIELVFERGAYVVKVAGAPLMASGSHGSEQQMAAVAAERLGPRSHPRVLVGGLGMGFTLRAALDCFGDQARVTVAELLPDVVRFNRGELGPLADHPLDDPRTELFAGDVRAPLERGGWDAVLMDVDNGPEAFTVAGNRALYGVAGVRLLAGALTAGGVAVVWSAFDSPRFEREIGRAGLPVDTVRLRARTSGKGPRHTLFVIQPR